MWSSESDSAWAKAHNRPVSTWLLPPLSSDTFAPRSEPSMRSASPGAVPWTFTPKASKASARPDMSRWSKVPSRSKARGASWREDRTPNMRNPNPDSPGVNVSVRGAKGKAPWMATASSPNSMSAPSWAAIIKAFVQSSHSEGRRIMVRPSAIMATATIRCITLLLGGAQTVSPVSLPGKTRRIMLASCVLCRWWQCRRSSLWPSHRRTPPCAFHPKRPRPQGKLAHSRGGRCTPQGLCSPICRRWA